MTPHPSFTAFNHLKEYHMNADNPPTGEAPENSPDTFVLATAALLTTGSIAFACWSIIDLLGVTPGSIALASIIDLIWIFFVVADWRGVHIFDRPWITSLGGFLALLGVEATIVTHAIHTGDVILGIAGPLLPIVAKIALFYAVTSLHATTGLTPSQAAKLQREERKARYAAALARNQAEIDAIHQEAADEAALLTEIKARERAHRLELATITMDETDLLARLSAEERAQKLVGHRTHRERMNAIASGSLSGDDTFSILEAPALTPAAKKTGFGFSGLVQSPTVKQAPITDTPAASAPTQTGLTLKPTSTALKLQLKHATRASDAARLALEAGLTPDEAVTLIARECPSLTEKSVKQALRRQSDKTGQ